MTYTIKEKEIINNIIKNSEIIGCLKCAIWDESARQHGKRGMCAECYEKNYVGISENGLAKTE